MLLRPAQPTNTTRPTIEDQLQRRLRDAEVMVIQTIERLRLDEEKRLAVWQDDFEQRLMLWRTEVEQSLMTRLAEPQTPVSEPLADPDGDLRRAVALAPSARDVGRILRDILAGLTSTSAFSLALHHRDRDEVVYRYRAAADDELGAVLRREPLDDGPEGLAAHMEGWARGQTTIRLGGRSVTIHTAQHIIGVDGVSFGVVTIQNEGAPIADGLLSRVVDLIALASPRLAELRHSGMYRGS